MKWYRKWQQTARNRYQAGYYPGHERMPNPIVLVLYSIGYFFGDFVPFIMNVIKGIYSTIKQLLAFISNLLIDASTGIVLIGTIVFSVFHSIELLRWAGATGGMEYMGVLMFEVIFIASAAMVTGSLAKRQKPDWFSLIGFTIGIFFVLTSNVTQMADNLIGFIIGVFTPVLLIVAEGILAFKYMNESEEKDETKVMEIIQRNRLTGGEINKAIEMYLANRKVDTAKVDTAKEETAQRADEPAQLVDDSAQWVGDATQLADDTAQSVGDAAQQEDETAQSVGDAAQQEDETAQSAGESPQQTEQSPKTPVEWAVHLYEVEGEPPSRRQLAEVASCSEWQARKALNELEQRIAS